MYYYINMDESCNVTVVITSCNRIQELLITLKSFFEYNTYKQIYKYNITIFIYCNINNEQ